MIFKNDVYFQVMEKPLAENQIAYLFILLYEKEYKMRLEI